MASPVVAGTVALMLQANPKLTPNLVKAIIQYTAQDYSYDALTQGAGFLNIKGAVDLARFLKNPQAGQRYPTNRAWSKTILWGNHKLQQRRDQAGGQRLGARHGLGRGAATPKATTSSGARVRRRASATTSCGAPRRWMPTTSCGAPSTREGDNIVWGTVPTRRQHRVGHGLRDVSATTSCGAPRAAAPTATTSCGASSVDEGELDNIVWGTADGSRQHRLGHQR